MFLAAVSACPRVARGRVRAALQPVSTSPTAPLGSPAKERSGLKLRWHRCFVGWRTKCARTIPSKLELKRQLMSGSPPIRPSLQVAGVVRKRIDSIDEESCKPCRAPLRAVRYEKCPKVVAGECVCHGRDLARGVRLSRLRASRGAERKQHEKREPSRR